MATWQHRFEIVNVPQNSTQANQLSIQATQLWGTRGWQVTAVVPLGTQMLLVMQKPALE
jgi:hypothetical protein